MADVVDMRGQPVLSSEETASRRVNILSSILGFIAGEGDWVDYHRVFTLIMCEHGLPEETVGSEILDSVFLLVRSGILICNTYDHASGVLTCGGDTKLMRSMVVKAYVLT